VFERIGLGGAHASSRAVLRVPQKIVSWGGVGDGPAWIFSVRPGQGLLGAADRIRRDTERSTRDACAPTQPSAFWRMQLRFGGVDSSCRADATLSGRPVPLLLPQGCGRVPLRLHLRRGRGSRS